MKDIHTRIKDDVHADFLACAQAEDSTMNAILRKLIREYISRWKGKK